MRAIGPLRAPNRAIHQRCRSPFQQDSHKEGNTTPDLLYFRDDNSCMGQNGGRASPHVLHEESRRRAVRRTLADERPKVVTTAPVFTSPASVIGPSDSAISGWSSVAASPAAKADKRLGLYVRQSQPLTTCDRGRKKPNARSASSANCDCTDRHCCMANPVTSRLSARGARAPLLNPCRHLLPPRAPRPDAPGRSPSETPGHVAAAHETPQVPANCGEVPTGA